MVQTAGWAYTCNGTNYPICKTLVLKWGWGGVGWGAFTPGWACTPNIAALVAKGSSHFSGRK